MSRSSRGVPLVGYPRTAGLPAITVARGDHPGAPPRVPGTHVHDFLVLLYLERGRHPVRVDGRDHPLVAGDAFVIAPGAAVTPGTHAHRVPGLWMVFFPADAVDPAAAASLVSWRTHPLLAPFVGGPRSGVARLPVPPEDRAAWLGHLSALDDELRERRDGYAEAAPAHLTLLLVRLGRLHPEVPAAAPGVAPLLGAVLDVIERRYHEPISLRDVADDLGLTPGHLTTVVGRRTGRTVQQWITERRMREARRLLADTELTMDDVAHRVGYREAGYFVRRFRVAHGGVTPAAWRRAGRRTSGAAAPGGSS